MHGLLDLGLLGLDVLVDRRSVVWAAVRGVLLVDPVLLFPAHAFAAGDLSSRPGFVEAARLRADEGTTVVMLLPNKLCQVGFVNGVNLHFDEVWTLGGRINFESPYSAKGGSSMNGCFFGILRPERIEPTILKHFTLSQIKGWNYDV